MTLVGPEPPSLSPELPEDFVGIITNLKQPPLQELCDWINGIPTESAAIYADVGRETLKVVREKPLADLQIGNFSCGWKRWQTAFQRVWKYSIEKEGYREGPPFEAFVETWTAYVSFELEQLEKRANGETVSPPSSEPEDNDPGFEAFKKAFAPDQAKEEEQPSYQDFEEAIDFLRQPPTPELCEWINSLSLEEAASFVESQNVALASVVGILHSELTITLFPCAWGERQQALFDVSRKFAVTSSPDREEGSGFATFVEAWVFYAILETKLLTKRTRGELVAPPPTGLDEASVAGVNSFKPRTAAISLRRYQRRLDLYERVLAGEESMRRADIVGLPMTAVAFHQRWDKMGLGESCDGASGFGFDRLIEDLIAQTALMVGALTQRAAGEEVGVREEDAEAEDLTRADIIAKRGNVKRRVEEAFEASGREIENIQGSYTEDLIETHQALGVADVRLQNLREWVIREEEALLRRLTDFRKNDYSQLVIKRSQRVLGEMMSKLEKIETDLKEKTTHIDNELMSVSGIVNRVLGDIDKTKN